MGKSQSKSNSRDYSDNKENRKAERLKNLKPQKSGEPSHNPLGRTKKVETLIKEYFLQEKNIKLSKTQIQEMIQSVLMKTRDELIDIAKNPDLPFWLAIIVKKAQKDFSSGSMDIVEKLLDRAYGKSTENIDTSIKTDSEIVILKIPDNNRNG